jgi:hypothetical protein
VEVKSLKLRLGVPELGWSIVALAAILRAFTCVRGYFYIDDFAFMGRAMEHALVDPAFLLETYNSHVMPGAFVWVWLTTHAFPLAWLPVAVGLVALQVAIGVMAWKLLSLTFGQRALALVPLALISISPISLPGMLWWAAALNQLPQQIAMLGMLLSLIRYLQTGSRRSALAGPLWLAGGLLFSEKTLLGLLVVVGFALWITTGSRGVRHVLAVPRRLAPLALGYAAVVLPFVALYVSFVPSPVRESSMPGHDVVSLAYSSIFRATIPGLIGGPFQWMPVGFAGGLADPNPFVVVLATIIVVGVIGLTCALFAGAWRAWTIFGVYLLANLVLLAVSRATVIGPVIGLEYRYQTEMALVFGIAMAFAMLPTSGKWRHPVTAVSERQSAVDAARRAVVDPLVAARALPARAMGTTLAMVAVPLLFAGSIWTQVNYDPWWVNNPAKAWVRTATVQLSSAPADTVLAPTYAPEWVAWGFIAPYNETQRVLSPAIHADRRLQPYVPAERLVAPDDTGQLRLAAVAGTSARPGSTPGCGWSLGPQQVEVPLRAPTADRQPVIRIGYQSDAATTLPVTLGETTVDLALKPGTGSFYVSMTSNIDHLTFGPSTTPATICTDDITAGAVVILPGTTP